MTRRSPQLLAVIEVGTNSCKFVVARPTPEASFRVVRFHKVTTRIGRGLHRNGKLSRSGVADTRKAIAAFVASLDSGVPVFAFSTYALRRASDAAEAIRSLSRMIGAPLRIISGSEEARFAYLSAIQTHGLKKPFAVIVDVGGGSTELVLGERGGSAHVTSLPVGALHLTERFLSQDPIDATEFGRLRVHVAARLERAWNRLTRGTFVGPSELDLVASGGSSTTLAHMLAGARGHRPASRLRSAALRVDARELRRLVSQCVSMRLQERRTLPGLEPDRADIIPAGLAIVDETLRLLRKRVLRVNPGGVRNGVITHLVRNGLRW